MDQPEAMKFANHCCGKQPLFGAHSFHVWEGRKMPGFGGYCPTCETAVSMLGGGVGFALRHWNLKVFDEAAPHRVVDLFLYEPAALARGLSRTVENLIWFPDKLVNPENLRETLIELPLGRYSPARFEERDPYYVSFSAHSGKLRKQFIKILDDLDIRFE